MSDIKILVPNRPTEAGRSLGAQLARLTDKEEVRIRQQFPNHIERCKSCAFRAGTLPNGCEITLMDAIKAVVENVPFMCHQQFDENGEPTTICAGFAILQNTEFARSQLGKDIAAPWDFSE